jgi:stage V sporulation protein B
VKSSKKLDFFGSFLTGAAILAFAGVICRLLGVVIRIPLTNIVGNFGMGLYQMVFPLYALLLIVSSAGVPIAISKMVAKEKIGGNIENCKKILINSLILLGAVGFVVSALFMIFANQIAALQGNRSVGIIYLAIAPSIFFVCLISAFRGYFQGFQNMIPTAASQILEQIVKVGVGISLASLFIGTSVTMAVFGAILAITISEIVALFFLVATYQFLRKRGGNPTRKTAGKGTGHFKNYISFPLIGQILKQSFPITLMASVFPLILVFDSMIVINILKASGTAHETATQLFGISSGTVHTLINLPAVLGAAVATSVVPTVSSLLKQNKIDELRSKCALSIKITFLISLFFVAFYIAFAEKIIDLLYHGAFKDNAEHLKTAANLMKVESALILLMGISSVFTAMLQGADKAKFPLIALGVGGIAKIAFELAYLGGPMGIYTVSYGNIICFALASVLNTAFALHFVRIKKGLWSYSMKALMLTLIFVVFIAVLAKVMPDNRWWVLLSGVISFVMYAILVAFFRFFRLN